MPYGFREGDPEVQMVLEQVCHDWTTVAVTSRFGGCVVGGGNILAFLHGVPVLEYYLSEAIIFTKKQAV